MRRLRRSPSPRRPREVVEMNSGAFSGDYFAAVYHGSRDALSGERVGVCSRSTAHIEDGLVLIYMYDMEEQKTLRTMIPASRPSIMV